MGIEPDPDLIDRYRRADAALFPQAASSADAGLVALVLRRPAVLPLVDAAAGLLRPANLLRRKLLVLSAILETDAAHVDRFEPIQAGPVAFLTRAALAGLAVGFKALLGLPFYLSATWRR